MFKHTPVFHQLLISIELNTPMSIGQGYGETGFDVLLLRDANGLPTISGSTLAGMLRDEFSKQSSDSEVEALFGGGATNRNKASVKEPKISNLQISFAHVHSSKNHSLTGLKGDLPGMADPVLELLAEDHPITRERVALTDKGVASDKGKFDISATPAGARFTFEISGWFAEQDPPLWQKIKAILVNANLRLGRSKYSGFGAFKVIKMGQCICDMTTDKGRESFAQIGSAMDFTKTEEIDQVAAEKNGNYLYKVCYQSDGLLRMGGNGATLKDYGSERTPDMLTQIEKRVCWNNNAATIENAVVIPGSAIKGALRHRFSYHINRLAKRFNYEDASHCPEADTLFGFAKDSGSKSGNDSGQAGSLIIDDVYISPDQVTAMVLQHNAIDRFTGGTIDGALYSEEGLWDVKFAFTVHYQPQNPEEKIADISSAALEATLQDLVSGRLPLGAGGSRGNGSANPESSHFEAGVNNREVAA